MDDFIFPEKDIDLKLKRAQSLVGYNNIERNFDFYPTPKFATESLLQKEKFIGNILEPAAGDGSMSIVLEEHGYDVTSRDLIYRGYGEGGINFLHSSEKFDNIITNPPFTLAEEFVRHALSLANNKVAMLCKLQFLEGAKRKIMFETTPLKSVYVFSKRLSMTRNGEKMKNSGMIAFSWFLFDHSYSGAPTLSWI